LISNCIFTWAITRRKRRNIAKIRLWIDFKLYFYVSNHKWVAIHKKTKEVVNWFQIVFLREQSQGSIVITCVICCCELISNCIFTWAITRTQVDKRVKWLLWIDFKLYFYVSNHKNHRQNPRGKSVVNWFQIVFLREHSQEAH